MSRRSAALLLAGIGVPVAAAPAAAHGLAAKEDLPIPAWMFTWGATVVLVVSFVALALLWREPKLEDAPERPWFGVPRVLEVVTGIIGVGVFALVVYAGLAGVPNPQANIAPTLIFIVFWVATPILSLLLGDVFAAFNPWRAAGRLAGWIARRAGREPRHRPYPERLGHWPAAAMILLFAWVELASADGEDPQALAVMALLYAAIQLAGQAVYGERAWTANADGFAVYFRLFSRLSPLQWHDGRAWRRRPASAITELWPRPGLVALVIVSIGTTSFDGFSQGPFWRDVRGELVATFQDAGFAGQTPATLAATVGLVVAVLLVGSFYRLGIAGMRSVDRSRSAAELGAAFSHTLVPIAVAYLVAHYFSLLAYQGQALGYLASDPLGKGRDYFGTAGWTVDYGWISSNALWWIQVGALVVGHVVGLILAHDRAIRFYKTATAATRSQYWMLGVMVGFTSFALWLLSGGD